MRDRLTRLVSSRLCRLTLVALTLSVALHGRAAATPADDRWWFAPVERLVLALQYAEEVERPYSTTMRPRDLTVGEIRITCEHQEGRPCGDGAGAFTELDTGAGNGSWLDARTRIRLQAGTGYEHNGFSLDRAHLDARLRHVWLGAGRDVLRLGPSARTQVGWGNNAAPLDKLDVGVLPLQVHDDVWIAGRYVLGRLRAPQRFPGTLVSIPRAELIIDNLAIGVMQMIQLEGDGARHLGVGDFLLEHIRRGDISADASDSSNRRFGGDVSLAIPELHVARIYYTVMFEDIRRKRLIDAIRYDADHLLGVEVTDVAGTRNGFVVEWLKTGVRSQEHSIRTTGFTNAGRLVGSPLGPDTESIYGGVQLRWAVFGLMPWFEFAQLSSTAYTIVENGPITATSIGRSEDRYRCGIRAHTSLTRDLELELEVLGERVTNFAFEPGHTENNFEVASAVSWIPGVDIARAPAFGTR